MTTFTSSSIQARRNHIGATTSYRDYFTPPTPERRTISYGDRVFVRLTMMSGESMEFFVTTANGMSELIGEVRRKARRLHGLGTLWIRNMSWGWSTDRPIKLYGSSWTPPSRPGLSGTHSLTSARPTPTPRLRNLGPWDTH